VYGVRGRDCSQCEPRHVLTAAKRCKDCGGVCSAFLLDQVEDAVTYLDESNVANMDPTPKLTMLSFQKRRKRLLQRMTEVKDDRAHFYNMVGTTDLLEPQSELVMLEAEKFIKSTRRQKSEARGMLKTTRNINAEINSLASDVGDIIRHLQNYAVGESAEISLKSALQEAKITLKAVGMRDHSDSDITVRTELSYARQTLSMVRGVLFGRGEIEGMKERVEATERKINDLLQYIDRALNNVREVSLTVLISSISAHNLLSRFLGFQNQ
jgi:HAMP domain-containing protein